MTEQCPLVSIGIPTFNRAQNLTRAVRSACGQDYQNLEIVIVDNASTDETPIICTAFCTTDSRIRYVRQPFNRGPIPNFAEALRQSRGQYFLWLSDDDWIDRNYVSQCVQFLNRHPDYVLAGGIDQCGRSDGTTFDGRAVELSQHSPAARLLHYYHCVRTNGPFYGVMRRQDVARIPFRVVTGWDWLVVAAMAFQGKVHINHRIFVHKSARGESDLYAKLAATSTWTRIIVMCARAGLAYLAVSVSAFEDIVWCCPIYRTLRLPTRLGVGMAAVVVVLANNSRFLSGKFSSLIAFKRKIGV